MDNGCETPLNGDPFPPERVVRVFVSSAFQGMEREREFLGKHVFPRVRKYCEERDLAFAEVDLRWGITEQQCDRGELLPVIFDEIDRCRPFFVALLGERYGSAPRGGIPAELQQKYAWLRSAGEQSTTELEIRHATENAHGCGEALFYIREPAAGLLARLKHRTPAVEVEALNLRDRIALMQPRVGRYKTLDQLAAIVERDLYAAIERRYPPTGHDPSPHKYEIDQHGAAVVRLARGFVGREEELGKLDAHLASDGPPLLVLGAPGLGKTALLCEWVRRLREKHARSDLLVLTHIVEATPGSADTKRMTRRLAFLLGERAGTMVESSSDQTQILTEICRLLREVVTQGPVVLAVDGIDQLGPQEGLTDLRWLPLRLPPGVHVVLTASPSPLLEMQFPRSWGAPLRLEPLSPEQRRTIATTYLAMYGKRLEGAHVDRLAGSAQTGNASFLMALLNELRLHGDYSTVGATLNGYLDASTLKSLYDRILTRWERDYESTHKGLVCDAFAFLSNVHGGLEESELVDLLGRGSAVPRIAWAELRLAAGEVLLDCGGVLRIRNQAFREVVQARYLSTETETSKVLRRLTKYFEQTAPLRRRVRELPALLWRTGQADRLRKVLSDVTFFTALVEDDLYTARRAWSWLEGTSRHRAVRTYARILSSPERYRTEQVRAVAGQLADSSSSLAAEPLWAWLAQEFTRKGALVDATQAKFARGLCLNTTGRLPEALAAFTSAAEEARAVEAYFLASGCERMAAVVEVAMGDAAGARRRLDACRNEARARDDELSEAYAQQSLALLQKDEAMAWGGDPRGDRQLLESSLPYAEAAQQTGSRFGDGYLEAQACGAQALILVHLGRFQDGAAKYEEEHAILEQLGDVQLLAMNCHNQGNLWRADRKLNRAAACFAEAEQLSSQCNDPDGIVAALVGLSSVHGLSGRPDLGWGLLMQALEIAERAELPLRIEQIHEICARISAGG